MRFNITTIIYIYIISVTVSVSSYLSIIQLVTYCYIYHNKISDGELYIYILYEYCLVSVAYSIKIISYKRYLVVASRV